MVTTLLILHALMSIALIGALTHQAVSTFRKPSPPHNFVGRFANVSGVSYTNAIIVMFLITAFLGDLVYPQYRLDIRTALEDLNLRAANGIFEIKEHFAAIGMFMLPAYWLYWRAPLNPDYARVRRWLTTILAFIVWWNLLVGHILNNIKGFGQ
jgi:uncharacterized membrane protein